MKKLYLLIFVLVFCYRPSLAQTFLWVNHNSHSIQFNPDYGVFPSSADGSGNFVIGTIHNFKLVYSTNFYGDVIIRRYNSSGTQLLAKIMTGKAAIEGIEIDAQGNIYVRGNFMDTLVIDQSNILLNTGSGFNINYFLIKLNSSGIVLWKKNISSIYGSDMEINAMKVRGNFLYAGLQTFNQGFVKKFDLNGVEQMSIPISDLRVISGIDADSHGNIYSTGSCEQGSITFGGLNANCPYVYSLFFVKFNSSGSGSWVRFVEDVTFEDPKLVCDADGNCFASGDLNGAFWFGNIQSVGPQWVYDFFVTKLDSSGTFLWLKEVPHSQSITGDAGIGNANNITIDNLNNVYFTGFQRGTISWGNVTTVSAGAHDVLVLKFSSNGNLIWGKTAGGVSGDRGDAISLDNSGNIYISGNFGQSAIFDTITVTGSGQLNSFAAKLTNPAIIGITNNENVPQSFSMTNYPNPFNPVTKIKFDIPLNVKSENSNVKIVIYDILGKEIGALVNEQLNPGTYEVNWNADGYPSGVYIYRLTAGEYTISKKMMLVK
jgi:hypothetical protein